MALVVLDHVSHAFGHRPLIDQASLQIERRERVAILGANGAGKSTLLRIVSGETRPDSGTVWQEPALRVTRVVQDVPLSDERRVFDVVADGLGDLKGLVTAYHHAAVRVTERGAAADLDHLGRLQHQLEEQDGWHLERRVGTVLSRLGLPADVPVETLSGGWRRRVLLARALVAEPDLLLLDEPTNHLDLDAIAWLEDFLATYAGAVVFVTHDRAFLQRLATRIVEIDRGQVTSWPDDYATFLRKKEEWLVVEKTRQEKFDRRLAGEEAWLRRGIKARRTRDEGRVRALTAMRAERAARRERAGTVQLEVEAARASGRLVIDARGVSRSFGAGPVVQAFSARIMRGDRIGVIGPNGAGKTTLLRLLIGELTPDEGEVHRGANVHLAYYDQQREQLDPDQTVFEALGGGLDTVTVNGQTRHVHGYLRDFLFAPEQAGSPVRSLSGGERNRLLLARLFTRPANLLVLDEPTNDLDIETLELLEQTLVEWQGTLLLVSHDRTFLDHVVTGTFVFEGHGRVQEYTGGYEDWLRQRPTPVPSGTVEPRRRLVEEPPAVQDPERAKLSYRERRELEALPGRIEALEAEQRELFDRSGHEDFYKETAAIINGTLARIAEIGVELDGLYARWDALDSRPG